MLRSSTAEGAVEESEVFKLQSVNDIWKRLGHRWTVYGRWPGTCQENSWILIEVCLSVMSLCNWRLDATIFKTRETERARVIWICMENKCDLYARGVQLNRCVERRRAVGATNFNKITSNKSKMDAVHSILDVDLQGFERWLQIRDVGCLMSTTRHKEYLGDGKHSRLSYCSLRKEAKHVDCLAAKWKPRKRTTTIEVF